MRVFGMEVKRILLSRRNQLFIIVGILISVVVPVFSVHSVQFRYIESNGTEITLSGLDAIKYRKNLYSDFEGEITTDKLEQALSQYQEGVAEAGGMNVDDEEFPYDIYQEKIAPVRELLNTVEEAYTIPGNGFWTWTPLEEISPSEMSEFYDKIENYRNDVIDYEYGGNQNIKNVAYDLSQKIDKPFEKYGIFSADSMEYLELTILLLVILCGAIAAPSFSENYENGSDHILRCTKYGRIHFGISKLSALFMVLAVYYLLCTFIQVGILNIAFGKESLKTSVQIFMSVVSLSPMNIGQLEMALVFGGLLTVLSTTCMIMFISAKMNTSFVSILISIVLIILPLILYFVLGISWIVFLFPSSGVGFQNSLLYQLSDMYFITIGKTVIWTPHMIYAVTTIELFIFIILSIRTYCKHQVI